MPQGELTEQELAAFEQTLGRLRRLRFDIVDGAARVYDPIVRGEAGSPVSGVFLKDYREAAW
ncbi:hypothetical protein KCMC57_up51460 [Kitasatospora sp. CMC57]|uniref:Uncharacterized protein n=1 Tax=Kitasatospora sp. CMC57 TaxID=3231513 RepID=A0AB33K7N8_9ACTN